MSKCHSKRYPAMLQNIIFTSEENKQTVYVVVINKFDFLKDKKCHLMLIKRGDLIMQLVFN